ncbi:MAG: PAS domain S-box protein [Janthinobacterium lividum]
MNEPLPRPDPRDPQWQVVAGLDDGVVLLGRGGAILSANPAALALHGVRAASGLGRTLDEYRARFPMRALRQPAAGQAPLDRLARGEAFGHLTVTLERPRGAPRWTWRIHALALADAPGSLALVIRDLTEEVDAEERFEDTFAANPAPAVICRLSDLRYVKVNAGFLEMTGHAREAVLGHTAYELDVLEDAAHRDTAIAHLRAGKTIRQQEGRLRCADGGRKLVVVAGHPISVGDTPCMLFTFVDLDPRHRAELALRQSEERFAAAFHLAPAPMLVVALDELRVLMVNDAFCLATGWRADQACGHTTGALQLWGGGEAQRSVERQAREGGRLRAVDVPLRAKGGSTLDHLLSADAVTIGGEPCVLCVMQDIAERRRTETELMDAIEAVMRDGPWLGQKIVEKMARLTTPGREGDTGALPDDLSAREREVLSLMARGLDDAAIADALSIARNTVRNHVSKLYRKIGVARRGAAVVWARERGLAAGPPAGKHGARRPGADRSAAG